MTLWRLDPLIQGYDQSGNVTLGKAAEIAGMNIISFKEILKDRGIKVEIVVDSEEELDKRSSVLDDQDG